MAFLDENGVAQFWAAVKDRLAGAFDSVEFDVAEQAANLVSGDSIATAFGKLAKNYSSLLTSISNLNTNLTSQINTKLNKSDVLANYTTTATGKALDASLGPAIKAKMDLADTLNTKVSKISETYATFYRGDIVPIDNSTQQTVTEMAANTDHWVTFPFAIDGWQVCGVLGYYFYGQGYYTDANVYVLAPSGGNGISFAIHVGSRGSWKNPKAAFTVLAKKTI